jgi:hypothetical protein
MRSGIAASAVLALAAVPLLAEESVDLDVIHQIKAEAFNNSKVRSTRSISPTCMVPGLPTPRAS